MILVAGREYGTAAQIAKRLGGDVTAAMVRRWRDRDDLETIRAGTLVYSPFDQAAQIERDKRVSTRGRRRRVDAGAALAA